MGDAAFVSRRETVQDAESDLDRLAHRHRSVSNALAQRRARQQFGDDISGAALAADVIERDDVGVIEGRGGPRFLLEARDAVGVCRQQLREDLDRDLAVQAGVLRSIDLAHSAFAQLVEDAVRAEFLTDQEIHLRRSSSGAIIWRASGRPPWPGGCVRLGSRITCARQMSQAGTRPSLVVIQD